jgi:membrane protein YqaA with SNARE-associated domain
MHHVVQWVEGLALAIGGPGLFLIAFIDASILSLPELNDLLIVWMVIQHKERMPYYVMMATLGSVAGCFVVYYLGRVGADAFLRRRFGGSRIARAERVVGRYGFMAVLVPAILPPPAPFKIFVLLAGVGAMPVRAFALAVGIGRGVRYLGEGLLAIEYGDQTIGYLKSHGQTFALATGIIVLLAGIAYFLWRRHRDLRESGAS